ncbi:hypothetical protein WJX73_001047 [Symbiochloris irregularis]|uniref:J domain-containing protein n=1 Tax=Symbiochloris irregularis TaxID=706552 RepID=A0AAW1NP57_9CHLO
MAEQQEGSSPLFAIFFLSIYSLLLIPITIWRLCAAAGSEDVVKPWEVAQKRKPSALTRFFRRLSKPSTFLLLLGWLVWVALLWYVQLAAQDLTPFDPFAILQVSPGAEKSEISRAYRKLSVQFHPDKNPDPAAHKYFAEFITKAYKALTDPVARKNYEQYGHPDGPQSIKLNVALPEWLINGDAKQAPLVLGGLVLFGILLPLGVAARYLLVSNKYAGPNQVMAETMEIFLRSKFAVKESQSLARVLDTLVYAMEFINMPVPAEQGPGLEELRKTVLRLHPELKEKSQWWKKRKSSIVKAHMLLLAHLGRAEIPDSLLADHKFVLTKSALLLEEVVKIATLPRPPLRLGWLAPALGGLEMLQCITQAVSVQSRKAVGQNSKNAGEATLAQMPHLDGETLKRLGRKRVRSLADLLTLPQTEQTATLTQAGLTAAQAEDVQTALVSVPTVHLQKVTCGLQGEDGVDDFDVMEGDVVTCSATVTLTRPSHTMQAFRRPTTGSTVQAFAPLFPGAREEKWYFCLADAPKNALLGLCPESLLKAEAAGVVETLGPHLPGQEEDDSGSGDDESEHFALENGDASDSAGPAENGGKGATTTKSRPDGGNSRNHSSQHLANGNGKALAASKEAAGKKRSRLPAAMQAEPQEVVLQFPAPAPGKYDLTFYCVSDCWVGRDVAVPVKLRVAEATRAEREGRAQRQLAAQEEAALLDSEEEDADDDEDKEDDDDAAGEYDSDETGTEESGSDNDDDSDVSLPELEEQAGSKSAYDINA